MRWIVVAVLSGLTGCGHVSQSELLEKHYKGEQTFPYSAQEFLRRMRLGVEKCAFYERSPKPSTEDENLWIYWASHRPVGTGVSHHLELKQNSDGSSTLKVWNIGPDDPNWLDLIKARQAEPEACWTIKGTLLGVVMEKQDS